MVFLAFYSVVDTFLREYLEVLPVALTEVLGLVALSGLWIAIAVAILKYHLYDIDVLINRTLVYVPLTAMLIVAYVGSVVLLQEILRASQARSPALQSSPPPLP